MDRGQFGAARSVEGKCVVMPNLTRLLALAALCALCGVVAVAGMFVLASLLWPAISLVAQALDVAFGWMVAHEKATSVALIVIAIGVLRLTTRERKD